MTVDLATLGLGVDSSQVVKANDNLDRLAATAKRTEGATRQLEAGAQRAARATDRLAAGASGAVGVFRQLQGVIGGVAAVLTAGALARYADTWSDINARVALAVGGMENGATVMGRLSQVARRTYSDLALTAESFLGNATALRELGFSTNQQLDFTEALNLALVVSGARAERAASVTNALTKAMAAGRLSGDQLNTVIQTGGRVAELIAKELGVTVNQLRALGAQGKITGAVINRALTGNLVLLREQAEAMPATIGDAFTLLGNRVLEFVGRLDQATGASARIAEAIIFVGDSLSIIARGAGVAGVALLGAFGPTILAAIRAVTVAIGTQLVTAVNVLTAALLANPLGAFGAAIAAIVRIVIAAVPAMLTALFLFRDEAREILGVDLVEIGRQGANRLIGLFVGTFRTVKEIFVALPGVVGEAIIGTVNVVIAAIEGMIQRAVDGINSLLGIVNAGREFFGNESLAPLGPANLGRVPNPLAGSGAAAFVNIGAGFADAMRTDFIAPFREAEEASRSVEDALTDLATATAGANDNIAGLGGATTGAAAKLNEFERAVQGVERRIEEYRLEAQTIGMTAMEVDRARVAFDLLHAAKQAGLPITADLTERVNGLATAYAEAAQTARQAQEQQQFMQQISGQVSSSLADMFTGIVTGAGNAQQAIGQLLQSLGRLLINRAFNALIGAIFPGGGGGVLPPPRPFAMGGVFSHGNVVPFARGGVVSSPTMFPMSGGRTGLMGEAGPEAIMPLARGPDGKLGVKAQGGASAQPQKVELVVKVEGARGNAEVMSMVQAGVGQALKAYDRQLPGRLQTIQKRQG